MQFHKLNNIEPKNRFEALLPFRIPEVSDEKQNWMRRGKIETVFQVYAGDTTPTLVVDQYIAWLQDLYLGELTEEKKRELESLIQENRETMIEPFKTLPAWFKTRLHQVERILEDHPEQVGHILPSWTACTNGEKPILIRKLLGATGKVPEFSEAEYEESVPLIEQIIKHVGKAAWNVAEEFSADSAEDIDSAIAARNKRIALTCADEIATLINDKLFKISDFFPSIETDREKIRAKLVQLMPFTMLDADEVGSRDVEKLIEALQK